MRTPSARLIGLASIVACLVWTSPASAQQHRPFVSPTAAIDLAPGEVMPAPSPTAGPVGAPEIDPAAFGSIATLLVGGSLLLQSRRRSRADTEAH